MTATSVKRIALSYREEPIGGEVRASPKITGQEEAALAGARHLVLLVHGYNNDLADAEKAFEGFHARQRDLDADERYGSGRTFVEVYWPGDAAWGIVSFLFYMGSITHAIETAGNLAAYLSERAGSAARIDIVAHSMGCRLALEVLRTLMGKPAGPQIGRIVFMAGAVATFMLEQRDPPRRLRPAYDHVLREGARSLFSGADMVLAFAFPAGQSLAPGPEGLLPTAIGHALWADATAPSNLSQSENFQAGHSDYWGWNTKPGPLQRALKAAQEVNNYLQFPSAGSRTVDTRSPVESTAIEARTIDTSREIVRRDIEVYS
jgi:pimeloyl-ACP methyl ester carboxylesterase